MVADEFMDEEDLGVDRGGEGVGGGEEVVFGVVFYAAYVGGLFVFWETLVVCYFLCF